MPPTSTVDPRPFFDSTDPTGGSKELLTNLVDRFLVSTGHAPSYHSSILCLDTTFGGSKTCDLIADYHLAASSDYIGNLANYLGDADGAPLDACQEVLDDGLSGEMPEALVDMVPPGLIVETFDVSALSTECVH